MCRTELNQLLVGEIVGTALRSRKEKQFLVFYFLQHDPHQQKWLAHTDELLFPHWANIWSLCWRRQSDQHAIFMSNCKLAFSDFLSTQRIKELTLTNTIKEHYYLLISFLALFTGHYFLGWYEFLVLVFSVLLCFQEITEVTPKHSLKAIYSAVYDGSCKMSVHYKD